MNPTDSRPATVTHCVRTLLIGLALTGCGGSDIVTPTDTFTFSAIDAGNAVSCGVTSGGSGYCWGNNTTGELGNGTTTSSAMAVVLSGGLLSFGAVSVGNSLDRVDQHACALTRGGRVYCWGYNGFGEIGYGTKNNSLIPAATSAGVTFTALRAGGSHTAA
jgi:alpha-tubulin suppressor-like RCC1 family protein